MMIAAAIESIKSLYQQLNKPHLVLFLASGCASLATALLRSVRVSSWQVTHLSTLRLRSLAVETPVPSRAISLPNRCLFKIQKLRANIEMYWPIDNRREIEKCTFNGSPGWCFSLLPTTIFPCGLDELWWNYLGWLFIVIPALISSHLLCWARQCRLLSAVFLSCFIYL